MWPCGKGKGPGATPRVEHSKAVDGEGWGRHQKDHSTGRGMAPAELPSGSWHFRGMWLDFTKNETEQLRTKLSMAEDINYLRGAAIPLGRKGKGGRRAVRN